MTHPHTDDADMDKATRTRMHPNLPELSDESERKPGPWRVTEWAEGYDVLGQPTDKAKLKDE